MYFRTCRTRGRLKYKLSSVKSLITKVTQQIIFCYSCNFISVTQTVIHHKNSKFDTFSFPGTILGNMTARIFNLNLIRIFYYLRTAKNFWMAVPFMCNFQSLSNKLPTIFWSFNFSHSTPQARLFFEGKRKPKIFGFKNLRGRGIKTFFTFVMR